MKNKVYIFSFSIAVVIATALVSIAVMMYGDHQIVVAEQQAKKEQEARVAAYIAASRSTANVQPTPNIPIQMGLIKDK